MCLQAARSTDMSDYRLFPCLRATADLLMMPKEVGREGWAVCHALEPFRALEALALERGRAGACWPR